MKDIITTIEKRSIATSSYVRFFRKATGFEPYDFQKELYKHYVKKEGIILKAPTGAGKTWASILPFIFTYKDKDMPKKLIYSLPLRTLANELYEKVNSNEMVKEKGIKVSIQTGEFPNDKFFESDIIFTTIDQTLSSILGFPYALSKRQANINAGAIIGSYLIFDEFHLLDPLRSFQTSLNVLKILRKVAPFCVMTATISDESVEKIGEFLNSIPITLSKTDVEVISILKNKKSVTVKERELQSNDILKEHKNKTIVICNTVEKAQKLYLDLKKKTNAELICIHSRFFKEDRIRKEKKIIDIFGKNAKVCKGAILISTQVIEVGLDISCDTMHMEISPINSLVQRAGRCARFENEQGRIFIYDVKKNDKGMKLYLPYKKELCANTMKELKKLNSFNYAIGERIVNKILTKKEDEEIENAKSFDFFQIKKSWEESEKGRGRQLIRDIDSVSVVLLRHNNYAGSIFNYEAISVNPHTLIKQLEEVSKKMDEDEPLVSVIEESSVIDDFEITKYDINRIPINNINLYPRIILNPKYVYYDNEIGLNFILKSKILAESNFIDLQERELFGYKKETYEEHIVNMINIYESQIKEKIHYLLAEIWNEYNFSKSLDETVKFMIIMHDYGKLNKKWQEIARNFQKSKGVYTEGEILAHTDFDPIKDKLPKRLPPHAGIGAMVSFAILEDVMDNENEIKTIGKTIFSAILRHHSTTSYKSIPYEIEDDGFNLVRRLIKHYAPSFGNFVPNKKVLRKWASEEDLSQYTINFSNLREAFLYFIFVRILRLCDQKSMENNNGGKYGSK